MAKKTVSIILARGGSKGIPRKNIKDFLGKPLLAWTIIQALKAPEIDEVYLSSDDDEFLEIGKEYGANPIKRPDEISGDKATSESAVIHAIEQLGPDNVELVYMMEPTSLLRRPSDFTMAMEELKNNNLDSVFGVAVLFYYVVERGEG
jgi:CMP-N,N'-diacetyllegionaminic acid synthase